MEQDWNDLNGFKEAVQRLDPNTTYREFCACLVGVGFDRQFSDTMPGEDLAGEVMDILTSIPEDRRWALALSIMFSGGARTELSTSKVHEQLADAFRSLLKQTEQAIKQDAPADEVLEEIVRSFGEGMNEMQKRSAIDSEDAEPFIMASSACFDSEGKDLRTNKVLEMKAKQFSREVSEMRKDGKVANRNEGVNIAMTKMAKFMSRVMVGLDD